jgi:hypothetical protein
LAAHIALQKQLFDRQAVFSAVMPIMPFPHPLLEDAPSSKSAYSFKNMFLVFERVAE